MKELVFLVLGLTVVFCMQPEQVHLAVTGRYDEMAVVWVTRAPGDSHPPTDQGEPSCMGSPDEWVQYPYKDAIAEHLSRVSQISTDGGQFVQFGILDSELNMTVGAVSYTYAIEPFWHWELQSALLTGLAPSTQYFYRVGNDSTGWTAVMSFKTESDDPSPTRIAFIGDMGTPISGTGFVTADRLLKDLSTYDLLILAGDIAYMYLFEPVWDWWFKHISPVAQTVPWMVAPGNQDADFQFAGYRNRFRMPAQESGSNSTFYFSFDYGYTHYVAISTEHDSSLGSAQHQWLQQDLARANANRAARPWVVVYGHRPIYCSNRVWCPDNGKLRSHIEPLLLENQVDLVLWGHVHMYERTWPVANNVTVQTNYINPKAPVHVTVGTAGAMLCAYLGPQPDWSALRSLQFGYSRIQTYNATHLHFEFVKQINGAVFDDFWLVNDRLY